MPISNISRSKKLFTVGAIVTFCAISIGIFYLQPNKLNVSELAPTAIGETTIDIMVLYNDAAAKLYNDNPETRINHLIDVSNQIYVDSGVNLSLHLVHTQKIDYESGYDAEIAINQLTEQSHPAFKDVSALRTQYGADLVVLMRPYANDGFCGLAWIGGYHKDGNFSAAREKDYGYSHVSIDCSTYVLSHELGHNMGLNHSRRQNTAGGTFDFALGHGMDNDFVTVMAYSSTFGASKIKLFSSPDLSCGFDSCGIDRNSPQGADSVYTLNYVAPQIARYFPTEVVETDNWGPQIRYDSNGDGTSDLVLHHASGDWQLNTLSGAKVNAVLDLSLPQETEWHLQGRDDYNGDGLADILLRNSQTGAWKIFLLDNNTILQQGSITLTTNLDWSVAGNGDFDGDGKGDILLRNKDGRWYQYQLNGTKVKSTAIPDIPDNRDYTISAVADFNGDGKTDILLRLADGGWQLYHMNGSKVTNSNSVAMKKSQDWQVVSSGDYNGDEIDDILLRYKNGNWLIYQFNNFAVSTSNFLELTDDMDWSFVSSGDFDGDGATDILMRHDTFGTWRLYTMEENRVKLSTDVPLTTNLDWLSRG
ncbi:MAG: VCBS repeat-containing protein [Pseudomonadales bacterium]|nr:VCBS repeat-containing protein [Pseudomonadales bacterium]